MHQRTEHHSLCGVKENLFFELSFVSEDRYIVRNAFSMTPKSVTAIRCFYERFQKLLCVRKAGWSVHRLTGETHVTVYNVKRIWRRWIEEGNMYHACIILLSRFTFSWIFKKRTKLQNIKEYFWTDSRMQRIKKYGCSGARNRIAGIHKLTQRKDCRQIPTQYNLCWFTFEILFSSKTPFFKIVRGIYLPANW